MLAKIWKKLLFAICIIACIYNIMNKLVTRTSLENNLRSIINQTSIIKSQKESLNYEDNESSEIDNNNEVEKDDDTIVVIY